MSVEKTTEEKLNEVVDLIHDVAARAVGEKDIPRKVGIALDEIISLARYKMNVTNSRQD